MAIETTTGGVTTSGSGSMDISVFYKRDAATDFRPLHEAERDPKSGIGSAGSVEVTPSGLKRTGKTWAVKRNVYKDGSLLKLSIRTTGGGSIFPAISNFILAPRSNGPLWELGIKLPTDLNSSRSMAYVIGRFDILSPEEVAERELDVGTNGSDESMLYDDYKTSEFLAPVLKERELAARSKVKLQTVQTASGEKKRIPKLRLARRINLPR